ncbi:MAG: LysR substrate-binding domain-containing protein [Pseudomonadota bacterium]
MSLRRLPPLNALRAFEAVARHSSIKLAAEELFVTAAAVSQQLKKLEDDLGVTLFVRHNRQLEITADGALLARGLGDAFQQMRCVVDDVRPRERERCIVVACGPPFASKFLAPRLTPFLDANPELDVRVVSDFRRMDYDEHAIDLGVRLTASEPQGIDFEWLDEERIVPLATPEYLAKLEIQAPKDLVRATLLEDENRSINRAVTTWQDWFIAAGVPDLTPKRMINFGVNIDQALDAAAAGMGVVLGTAVLASLAIGSGRLKCPFGPALGMGLRHQLLIRRNERQLKQVCLFKDWLQQEIGEASKSIDNMLLPKAR